MRLNQLKKILKKDNITNKAVQKPRKFRLKIVFSAIRWH